MSGMTATSAQPTENGPQAFLLPERRPASSLAREPNAQLSWHAAVWAFKCGTGLKKVTHPRQKRALSAGFLLRSKGPRAMILREGPFQVVRRIEVTRFLPRVVYRSCES